MRRCPHFIRSYIKKKNCLPRSSFFFTFLFIGESLGVTFATFKVLPSLRQPPPHQPLQRSSEKIQSTRSIDLNQLRLPGSSHNVWGEKTEKNEKSFFIYLCLQQKKKTLLFLIFPLRKRRERMFLPGREEIMVASVLKRKSRINNRCTLKKRLACRSLLHDVAEHDP